MRETIKHASEFEYSENEHVKGDALNYQELIWLQLNRINLMASGIDLRDYHSIQKFKTALRSLSSIIRAASRGNDEYITKSEKVVLQIEAYDKALYLRQPDKRTLYLEKLFDWYDIMIDVLHDKGFLLDSDVTIYAGSARRNTWKKK